MLSHRVQPAPGTWPCAGQEAKPARRVQPCRFYAANRMSAGAALSAPSCVARCHALYVWLAGDHTEARNPETAPLLVAHGPLYGVQVTTLKRNGSDYSATILGALFQSGHITIWTDVDGVYSADPRKVCACVEDCVGLR